LKEVFVFTLLRRYWSDLVSYEGGMALLLIDGLLFIPLVMAAFFYPIQVLAGVGTVLILAIIVFEGIALWRKRHPHAHVPHART
jgi:hypothetical protein